MGLISATEVQTYLHNHERSQHRFSPRHQVHVAGLFDPFYLKNSNTVMNCVGTNIYGRVWGLYHLEPMISEPSSLAGTVPGWLPEGDLMTRKAYREQGKQYLTLSTGPNRIHNAPCGVLYDISNGVMSPGDIIGFGPP
ncbi:hypothetical protein HS125_17660 [bacterium]|nr:hypothetical protein [bacterium]